MLPSEDGELLAQREVLDDQVGPAGEDREESPGDGKSAVEHPRTMTAVGTGATGLVRGRFGYPAQGRNSLKGKADGVLARDNLR